MAFIKMSGGGGEQLRWSEVEVFLLVTAIKPNGS